MAAPKYRYEHQRTREALLPQAYGKPCLHCGYVMLPHQRLALDHTADGKSYRGIVHLTCNARDGGRRGAARRKKTSVIFP